MHYFPTVCKIVRDWVIAIDSAIPVVIDLIFPCLVSTLWDVKNGMEYVKLPVVISHLLDQICSRYVSLFGDW